MLLHIIPSPTLIIIHHSRPVTVDNIQYPIIHWKFKAPFLKQQCSRLLLKISLPPPQSPRMLFITSQSLCQTPLVMFQPKAGHSVS